MSYQYQDSFVFYRHLNRSYPRIARGSGIYLFDEKGKQYLDAAGGAMVANIGHGVSEVADAVTSQMRDVAYVNGMMFTNLWPNVGHVDGVGWRPGGCLRLPSSSRKIKLWSWFRFSSCHCSR